MIRIFIRSVGGSIIIRNVTIRITEKDLELVYGLQEVGVNRNVALVIAFLKDQKERYFKEIETATRLRQPEVSIAMRTLRERDWLTEYDLKIEGKGRPLKIYALRATIDEIVNYYEMEKCRESARAKESIQRLKELSSA